MLSPLETYPIIFDSFTHSIEAKGQSNWIVTRKGTPWRPPTCVFISEPEIEFLLHTLSTQDVLTTESVLEVLYGAQFNATTL